MKSLMTKISDEFKNENGITVGELIEILEKFPADTDIRVDSIYGEELLEIVQSSASFTEDAPNADYKYLLLKAQDIDSVQEVFNDEMLCLAAIRKAFAEYYEMQRNPAMYGTAGSSFIDAVGKILEEFDDEFCPESQILELSK